MRPPGKRNPTYPSIDQGLGFLGKKVSLQFWSASPDFGGPRERVACPGHIQELGGAFGEPYN